MQRFLLVSCVFILTVWLFACSPVESTNEAASVVVDQGDTYQAALRAKATQQEQQVQLTVLYVPAEGFAYLDPQGQLSGVSIEIMQDFASWLRQQHNLPVALNFIAETNWQQFYQRVVKAEGGVFGLGNVTITEPRKQALKFSPAYLHNIAALITHQDVQALPDWQALPVYFAELQPLAFSGTLHEQRINRLRDQYQPEAVIQQVSSNPDLLAQVASGNYYAYVDAYNYWRAREAGMPLRDHPIAAESGETFGFIMPLNSDWDSLLEAFFAAEGGYLQSTRYQQILTQQLGTELAQLLLANQTAGNQSN